MNRNQKYPRGGAQTYKTPSKAKIVIKSCLSVFLACMIVFLVIGIVENIRFSYEYGSNSPSRVMEMLDMSYYDQAYGNLLNSLKVYDAYGEEYDKYWEVVDTYAEYLKYKDMVNIPGYETEAEKQLAVLEKAVENCRNSENTKRLGKMLSDARALSMGQTEAEI